MINLEIEKNRICFDEKNAVIDSLECDGKEYIYKKVPVFEIAFRNLVGDKIITDAGEMTFIESKGLENGFSGFYEK